MFSCRVVCHRLAPLARRAATRLRQDAVQRRCMAMGPGGSVPGGSGENVLYVLLFAGGLVGAVSCGYFTVVSDRALFTERIEQIASRSKSEWTSEPWPPKSTDEDEGEDQEVGAAAEAEIVVEEAAQEVVKVAQEVEAVAQEVEAVSQEVEAVVQEVEAVVQEVEAVVQEVEAVSQEVEAVAQEVEAVAQEVEAVAQEVEAVAQEVEEAAQEVVKVSESVEEAAQAVEEPPAVTVEEPESDGMTSSSEEEA